MAHILVVDDEPWILEIIEAALEQHGHIITTANSGKKALDLLKHKHFDMIITDILMPEIDGIQLTMEIEKSKLSIPIIVMSGGGRLSSAKSVLQYVEPIPSVYRTFKKPFCPSSLCEVVNSALENPSKKAIMSE